MLHESAHHLIHVAVDAQVSLAVMFCGLQVDNDQTASSALSGKGQVPTGADLQRGTQGDRQVCGPAGLISEHQVPVRQRVLPVQNGVSQLPSTGPKSPGLGHGAEPACGLEAHGAHNRVSDVLRLTLGTFLYKHVSVQLCQLVPGEARAHVQPVYVLADQEAEEAHAF